MRRHDPSRVATGGRGGVMELTGGGGSGREQWGVDWCGCGERGTTS